VAASFAAECHANLAGELYRLFPGLPKARAIQAAAALFFADLAALRSAQTLSVSGPEGRVPESTEKAKSTAPLRWPARALSTLPALRLRRWQR
jgi:hypothetical protein